MGCDVGHRGGTDPMLLWLWHRPAAVASIGSLAWEFSFFFFFFHHINKFNFFISPIHYFFSTIQHGDPVTHTCIHYLFSHYYAPSKEKKIGVSWCSLVAHWFKYPALSLMLETWLAVVACAGWIPSQETSVCCGCSQIKKKKVYHRVS